MRNVLTTINIQLRAGDCTSIIRSEENDGLCTGIQIPKFFAGNRPQKRDVRAFPALFIFSGQMPGADDEKSSIYFIEGINDNIDPFIRDKSRNNKVIVTAPAVRPEDACIQRRIDDFRVPFVGMRNALLDEL